MSNYKILIIRNKTNMLVGSGKSNFGIVDQLVQRDVITGFPNINASGIKGAFKEFITNNNSNAVNIKEIFGSEKGNNDSQTGAYHFFNADLLSIPIRSNKTPFLNATCPLLICQFLEMCSHFESAIDEELKNDLEALSSLIVGDTNCFVFDELYKSATMEDEDIFSPATLHPFDLSAKLRNLLGGKLILVSDKIFKMLTSDLFLPVIPRNSLGENKNLWYEQVIPRESRFFTFVYGEEQWANFYSNFDGKAVQIGSNATIGYGWCEIKNIDNLISPVNKA